MSTETLQPPIELSKTPISDFKRRMRELLQKLYEKYNIGKKATDQTTAAEPDTVAGPDTASLAEKLKMMPILMNEFIASHKEEFSKYQTGESIIESGSGATNDPFVIALLIPSEAHRLMKAFNNYIGELGYKKGVYYQRIRGNAHDRLYFVDENNEVETLLSTNELIANRLADAEKKYGIRTYPNQEISKQTS